MQLQWRHDYLKGDLFVDCKEFESLLSDSTVTGDCGKEAPRPLSLSSSLPALCRNDGGLNTVQARYHSMARRVSALELSNNNQNAMVDVDK